jgi:hypothetical protein
LIKEKQDLLIMALFAFLLFTFAFLSTLQNRHPLPVRGRGRCLVTPAAPQIQGGRAVFRFEADHFFKM